MYAALKNDRPKSKLYVSTHTLPFYIDAQQPPNKKAPFSNILSQEFNHSVLLPFAFAAGSVRHPDYVYVGRSHITYRASQPHMGGCGAKIGDDQVPESDYDSGRGLEWRFFL